MFKMYGTSLVAQLKEVKTLGRFKKVDTIGWLKEALGQLNEVLS